MAIGEQKNKSSEAELRPGMVVSGPLLPEPVEILVITNYGTSIGLTGRGLKTNQVHRPILSLDQIAQLTVSPVREPFDGDPQLFRLGVEALRLGLAYEYDPFLIDTRYWELANQSPETSDVWPVAVVPLSRPRASKL
jgi:hypothetical protein